MGLPGDFREVSAGLQPGLKAAGTPGAAAGVCCAGRIFRRGSGAVAEEMLQTPASAAAAPARRRGPWWLPPIFGRVPELEPRVVSTLGLVSVGLMFDNYDQGLINSALKQIAESLGVATGQTGYFLAAIRLGGLGTFLLLPLADRLGRRRLFLASFIGMSIGTLASGLAPTVLAFVLAQMFTRVFMLTAAALAVVFLVEEIPAEHRGWAIGAVSVMGGLGYGLGAGLYAAIEHLPFGWRSLYAVGVVPVLVLPLFRRALLETRRFESHRAGAAPAAAGLRAHFEPVVALARAAPRRAACVGLAGLLSAMGGIAFFQYASYFAQSVHGWAPWQYSLLLFGAGLVGVSGSVVGGRLADRIGRRAVGAASLVFMPLGAAFFYFGPGWSLVPSFAATIFCSSASDVVVRALAGELFPTGHRGTSVGWLILVQMLGFSSGLFLVGLGTKHLEDLARMVTLVSLASAAAGLCLLPLPDTHRRELESIAAP
jgi:putative MFS transporter